jgi:arylformamidase
MRVYDLTLPIHEGMLLFPGDAPPRIRRVDSLESGVALMTSTFGMSCHVGTHVDAPAHFIAGARPLSDYPVEAFCGMAIVVDLSRERNVTADALRDHEIPPDRHVLLRTRNSAWLRTGDYDRDHAFVEPEAAEVLMERRPLSVGFDYYSVDPSTDTELTVHHRFAAAGRLAYVCLDLSRVPGGEYEFFGLPLSLDGVEAAPVRALLHE